MLAGMPCALGAHVTKHRRLIGGGWTLLLAGGKLPLHKGLQGKRRSALQLRA